MNAWQVAAIVAIVVVGLGALVWIDFHALLRRNPKPTIALPKAEVNRDPAAALRAGRVIGLQQARARIRYCLEGGEMDRSARRELKGLDEWLRNRVLATQTEGGR